MKTTIHLLATLLCLLGVVSAEDVPEGNVDIVEPTKPDPDLVSCPDGKCIKPIPIRCPRIKCPWNTHLYYNPKTKVCKCVPCHLLFCPTGQKGQYMPSSGICRCRPFTLEKREPDARSVQEVCPVYIQNPCEPGYTYNSDPYERPCGCYPNGDGYEPGDLQKRSAEPTLPEVKPAPTYPEPEEIPPCATIRCRSGYRPFNPPGTRRCFCKKDPQKYPKLEAREAEPQEAELPVAPEPEGTFPPQCIAVSCLPNTRVVYDPVKDQCQCIPLPPDPCALILCAPNTLPQVDPVTNKCNCVPVRPPPPAPCPLILCKPGTRPYRDPKTKQCRCVPCAVKCNPSQTSYYDDSQKRCTCRPRPLPVEKESR